MSAWNLDNARAPIGTLQVVLPAMDKLHQNLVSSFGITPLLFRFRSLFSPLFGYLSISAFSCFPSTSKFV
jgi:hypothetical protein